MSKHSKNCEIINESMIEKNQKKPRYILLINDSNPFWALNDENPEPFDERWWKNCFLFS